MKIFLSGIGGIGMSAYAAHRKHQGHDVSGSDKADSATVQDLISQGIAVSLRQDGSAVPEGTELLVYSEAVPESSPERQKALTLGIPQQSYFQALGELTKGTDLLAVCGTHGKSSTTAMLARIFMDAGMNPSVVVGTKMKELGGRNWRAGGDLWIVEACEYRRSFHHLKPKSVVLTNADGDHFDAFKDAAEYRQAFVDFVASMPDGGLLVGHGQDAETQAIAAAAKRTLIDADSSDLPETGTPGEHMRQNAQLALTMAVKRGIDPAKAKQSLKDFTGTWRRMEVKGETAQGVTVIDDYAHHPVEIRATIKAIRGAYPEKRLVCVFEPHTNDRVLKLWKEFTESFTEADLVLVTKVFDARPDKDKEQADAAKFAAEIGRTSKVACRPSGSITRTKATLETLLHPDDVLLVMGAGDSTKLASAMIS